jgi:hypothetical protein
MSPPIYLSPDRFEAIASPKPLLLLTASCRANAFHRPNLQRVTVGAATTIAVGPKTDLSATV